MGRSLSLRAVDVHGLGAGDWNGEFWTGFANGHRLEAGEDGILSGRARRIGSGRDDTVVL